MSISVRWVVGLSALALSLLPLRPAFPQATAPAAGAASTATAPGDYSKEPFVVEQYLKKDSFENDGKYAELTTVRIRVQSASAVRQFGLVSLPYESGTGNIELLYAKVTKADGTVVTTPAENILDMPADITREAPFYSDLKEKQVAIRGLDIGDVLEYQSRLTVTTPLVPGQFWFADDFPNDAIVLDAELQLSVPRDRYVKLKSPSKAPVTTEEKGYRIYTWKTSHLTSKQTGESGDSADQPQQDSAPPDVQLTTFRTWDEVAQWYRQLQQSRAAVTPEIRAKAQEIAGGATTDAEKIQKLYEYVATQYRYIGVAFGIGRYQPHTAAEVLGNGYGDCKDKHTLLSALLAASGIKSYPALLNASRTLDPDIPSPNQFDHMITVVPRGPQGKDLLWLDTTTEIAPEGYLTAGIRDKEALVIPDSGAGQLLRTPAAPPFDTTYDFRIVGSLDDDGTLDATVEGNIRGDMEYLLREALHRMPQPLWSNVVQSFVGSLGFPGAVSNPMVSSPESIEQPLHLTYDYTRPNYIDWAGHRMTPPLPRLAMPDLPADGAAGPIELQPMGTYSFDARIELPKGFMPMLPMPVDVKQDFAEFHASYALESGVLHAQRSLSIRVHEIPQSRRADYLALRKAVVDDEQFFIPLSSISSEWIQDSREAAGRGDIPTAVQFLQAATVIDPQNADAWLALGNMHALAGSTDLGISEMRKAIQMAPKYDSYRTLVDALSYLHRYPEALAALQEASKVAPDNLGVTWRMGQALLDMKRTGDAVSVLQPALDKNPKDARLALLLGQAYVRQGEADKALTAFQVVLDAATTPANLNVMARELAENDVRLDDALGFAQRAVNLQEDVTAKFAIDSLVSTNMIEMIRLAQEWDTEGLVRFRQGNLPEAEKYWIAAWKLLQSPGIGDHLGQLYEKLGRTDDATRFYTLAVATGQAPQETSDRLAKLIGGSDQVMPAARAAIPDLDAVRTLLLPRQFRGTAKGDFLLLFPPGSSTPQVKFIGGTEDMSAAIPAIAAAHYDLSFPDDRQENLIRQGTLTCDEASPTCKLLFTRLDIVNPIN